MSTAKFDTLSTLDGSQSVPVNTVAQGSAKAWVNFNGTGTVAIRAAFNVTSITDGGTGNYTLNFTNAMVDANYATETSMSQYLAYTVPGFASQVAAIGEKTTTSQRIYTGQASTSSNITWASLDYNEVCVAIFR